MAAAGLATAGALYLLHESGFTGTKLTEWNSHFSKSFLPPCITGGTLHIAGWVRDRVEELSIDDLPVEMRHVRRSASVAGGHLAACLLFKLLLL
jgi:hypothetical protein